MSNSWDYEQASPPLDDTKVDRLDEANTGEIDQLPTLTIDIPDNQIIKNLENRIQDSDGYWNSKGGFDLKTARAENMRIYLGKQLDVRSLYRFQIPYIENQIYVAEQAIVAYLTAQEPQPEATPAQDTPQSKIFASHLEKALMAHSQKVHLQQLLETSVRNTLNKRVGAIYFQFDPYHGKNGEIVPIAENPENIVFDKNARLGENPAFICRYLKMSVNEACSRWPDKKDEIYQECGIVRGTYKQLETILSIREVWLTHYDEQYQPQEAVVYYFGKLVLEKDRNPHWIYSNANRNFLDYCKKPFVMLNFDNMGDHLVDQTSALEQASKVQMILNKRGRQYMEVIDKANGTLVIDTRSGITKDDSQNLTGDPNQHIVIQGMPGVNNQELIYRLPPPEIPRDLLQDKIDLRTTIHAIMGTPSEFTGSNDGDDNAETLGQSMMKKNQASGRQDLYVRSIDRFMNDYFNMLVQMMCVWYTAKHFFVYNGGDGEFDYITISRDLIEDGIAVAIKSGTTLPYDKQRQEAIVLQLLKMGASISLLDAYKLLHMQNPQQLYDNWAKQQTDPSSLARDAFDEMDEAKAYITYTEIMNGKPAKDPDDCTKEYVLSLRKLMIRDEFLKAPKKYQTKFLAHVEKAITSLELRTGLDELSGGGIQNLEPSVPIPQAPPPQPIMPGGAPGMPGFPPPQAGQGPLPMPPGAPMGMPPPGAIPPPMPGGLPGSPMNGTPLPNPNNPVMPNPGDVTSLPIV